MSPRASFQVFLLRTTIRRYTEGASGRPRPGPGWAKIASFSDSDAELFRNACDAWDIPLGELARAAGLEQTVLSQFVMGVRPMSDVEREAVVKEMQAIVDRRSGG